MAEWERQKGETPKAYAAFCLYRDLPPDKRSCLNVQKVLYPGKPGSISQVERWSRFNNWLNRAQAWDDELDKQKRTQILESVKAMTDRQIGLGRAMIDKGFKALELIKPEDINVDSARLLINEGAKLERLARGEATERIDTGNGVNIYNWLAALPESQLRGYIELAERAESLEGVSAEGAGEETPGGLLPERVQLDASKPSQEVD